VDWEFVEKMSEEISGEASKEGKDFLTRSLVRYIYIFFWTYFGETFINVLFFCTTGSSGIWTRGKFDEKSLFFEIITPFNEAF